jgi:VIT1/CCC1 family predicted Fe2+/Mn2+ transporter
MRIIKDEYILYSMLAGFIMTSVIGIIFSIVLLVVVTFLSAVVLKISIKEKIVKLILRALAYGIGIALLYLFIYVRLKYNF